METGETVFTVNLFDENVSDVKHTKKPSTVYGKLYLYKLKINKQLVS